jgi:hypothetical protein
VAGGGARASARTRNAAISPRVTGAPGQKRVPSLLQPRVMVRFASQMMSSRKMDGPMSWKEVRRTRLTYASGLKGTCADRPKASNPTLSPSPEMARA